MSENLRTFALLIRNSAQKMLKRVIIITLVSACAFVHVGAIDYTYRDSYGIELSWQADNRVGITTGNISYGEMEQLAFWTSTSAMASRNDRSLYAIGYQLKTNTMYYSYSPYRWMESFDARAIKCDYTHQSQMGNGNAAGLAVVDFQMAKSMVGATECNFSYSHIGGVLRISFPAPETLDNATLSISAQKPVISTKATMDILTETAFPEERAYDLSLSCQNLSVSKGQQVVLYLACPAQDLSSEELDIIITDDNGTEHTVARIIGPDIKAGKLYNIAIGSSSQSEAPTMPRLTPKAVAGVANPTVHTDDILIDETFVLQIVDITGITAIPSENSNGTHYNLSGIKVSNPKNGEIYISNGKKYIHR